MLQSTVPFKVYLTLRKMLRLWRHEGCWLTGRIILLISVCCGGGRVPPDAWGNGADVSSRHVPLQSITLELTKKKKWFVKLCECVQMKPTMLMLALDFTCFHPCTSSGSMGENDTMRVSKLMAWHPGPPESLRLESSTEPPTPPEPLGGAQGIAEDHGT